MSTEEPDAQSRRDRHIQLIAQHGRTSGGRAKGYRRRNLVETTIGRYKHPVSPKLRARSLQGQQGEAAIAIAAINKMIRVAKPMTVRTGGRR